MIGTRGDFPGSQKYDSSMPITGLYTIERSNNNNNFSVVRFTFVNSIVKYFISVGTFKYASYFPPTNISKEFNAAISKARQKISRLTMPT